MEKGLTRKTSSALVPASRALATDEQPALVYVSSLSRNGRRAMEGRLRAVAQLLGHDDWREVPWEGIGYQHVQLIRTRLMESGQAPATINLALQALRGVAKASFDLGHIHADDLQRIKHVPLVGGERLPTGRALKPGEIAALFRVCEEDEGPAGARDAALLAIAYVGGLRRAEIAELNLADYDAEEAQIIVRGKRNKERLAHLSNGGTAGALADWLDIRGDEPGPLFVPVNKAGALECRRLSTTSVYKIIAKRAKEAGVTALTPHDMRRTFISDLLDAGADIATVQQMAGHASVETTARYDRRGEVAKRHASGLLHVPYHRRAQS